jgi:hypothetical protein
VSVRDDPRPSVLAYGAAKSLDITRTRAQACAQERMARRAARHGRPSSEVLNQIESVLRRNASAIGHHDRLRGMRRVP